MLDLRPENIRGVVYLDRLTPGVLDGIWVHFTDGSKCLYQGAELSHARSVVNDRFLVTPGSNKLSDQQVANMNGRMQARN